MSIINYQVNEIRLTIYRADKIQALNEDAVRYRLFTFFDCQSIVVAKEAHPE